MRHCLLAIGLVAVLLTAAALPALGCWADVPLETVVKDSPVIVVGKIERVELPDPPEPSDARRLDIGHIKVRKVLKNTLKDFELAPGDTIPLAMPSSLNKMRMSTDLYYKEGTDGVWILDRKDGKFRATYPKDHQPLEKLDEVLKAIKGE